MNKTISINFLNEVCINYINKNINSYTSKRGEKVELNGSYHLGIVNFQVAICQNEGLNTIELNTVKEIEFII